MRAGKPSKTSRLLSFTEERFGFSAIGKLLAEKSVPEHRYTFLYYWGGIALFFFIVQAVTGLLLMVYYQPGPDAYTSVARITMDIDFGWLVRSVHSWSAHLMIVTVAIHAVSVFFLRAYRKPREFEWWTGVVLFAFCCLFAFSGNLLPMNLLAYFAAKVGINSLGAIPAIGPILKGLACGGTDVGADTVQRFYTLHVAILPGLFVLFIAAHLFLVTKHGNTLPASEKEKKETERKSIPFFPNFFLRDMVAWLASFSLLVFLAFYFPREVGISADSLAPAPEGIHPEWYFMAPYQVIKVFGYCLPGVFGELAAMALFAVCGIVSLLIPMIDADGSDLRKAKLVMWVGILGIIACEALTIWAYLDLL